MILHLSWDADVSRTLSIASIAVLQAVSKPIVYSVQEMDQDRLFPEHRRVNSVGRKFLCSTERTVSSDNNDTIDAHVSGRCPLLFSVLPALPSPGNGKCKGWFLLFVQYQIHSLYPYLQYLLLISPHIRGEYLLLSVHLIIPIERQHDGCIHTRCIPTTCQYSYRFHCFFWHYCLPPILFHCTIFTKLFQYSFVLLWHFLL